MNFLRSVSSVGLFTIISRITGYCRDFLIIQLIGINIISDALNVAIRMPAFFRRLFAEGAFHVSFLPIFTETKKSSEFSGMALTSLIAMAGICTLIVEWQFEWFSRCLFSHSPEKIETLSLVIRFGRITFPYVFFISLASFFGSILNAYGRFSMLAASHAIGNITVIVCVMGMSLLSHDYGYLFAWAILISGVVQFICVMIVCWFYGYKVKLYWPKLTPAIKRFLRTFFPGMLGVGVIQLNILIGLIIGSCLPTGGISYLSYADRFNQLPLSIIGVSLSSVLLPLLSHHIRERNMIETNKIQNHALRFSALVTLPIMMFLICMAFPVVFILYGHGKLSTVQVQEIAKTIMAYGTGIPAYILIKIFNTRFFAHGQTKIPLIASAIGVSIDIVLSLLLVGPLQHLGIAFAVSVSAWVNAIFLTIILNKKYNWQISHFFWQFLGRIASSCILVGGVIAVAQYYYLPSFASISLWKQIMTFSILVAGGVFLLTILLIVWGVLTKRQLRTAINSFRSKKAYVME